MSEYNLLYTWDNNVITGESTDLNNQTYNICTQNYTCGMLFQIKYFQRLVCLYEYSSIHYYGSRTFVIELKRRYK